VTDGIANLATLVPVLAPLNLQGDELGSALAIPDDGLGQPDGQIQDCCPESSEVGRLGIDKGRVASLASRHQDETVVSGRIAVDGDAVEGQIGHLLDEGIQQRLGHIGIGGQKAQHGRHVRFDHAGPLGHTGQGHGLATDLHLAGRRLGHRVGGHDAVAGLDTSHRP
jgi:hypothetical protein